VVGGESGSPARARLHRLLALGLAPALLLLGEGIARLAGALPFHGPGPYLPPSVGLLTAELLERARALPPPADGRLRVLSLGESTSAGFPFPPDAAFGEALRRALASALGGDRVEVLTLAAPASTSLGLVALVEALPARSARAALLYCGHNEFYPRLTAPRSTPLTRSVDGLRRRSALFEWGRRALSPARSKPQPGPPLEPPPGTGPDTPWLRNLPLAPAERARILSDYGENVGRLFSVLREKGIEPVALLPASDPWAPPFASAAAIDGNGKALEAQEALGRGDFEGALEGFRRALRASPEDAFAAWGAGSALGSLSRRGEARPLLVEARDLDAAPLRVGASQARVLHDLCARSGVLLSDAHHEALEWGPEGGARSFVDPIHPTRARQREVARAAFEALLEAGILRDLPEDRREAVRRALREESDPPGEEEAIRASGDLFSGYLYLLLGNTHAGVERLERAQRGGRDEERTRRLLETGRRLLRERGGA
jgi:tetratricopeptide (TPR) repeat protein